MKTYKILLGLFAIITATFLYSCNKEFERTITDKNLGDTTTAKSGNRKVLYLIVDGARGQSVSTANIPNITALLNTSIYSWVALNEPGVTQNASNWANMLTGVKVAKHLVKDDALTNNNLQNYPIIFKRIKESRPQTKIAAYTSSPVFKSLNVGADISAQVANDDAVKNALINQFNTDTASLVIGHFTDVDKAGAASGYDNSFPQYKSAIEKFDSNVGEVLAALKRRANYANEDWLIIIASSDGGAYTLPPNTDDQTIFSKPESNSFIIYHNIRSNKRIIVKPFTGNRYLGKTVKLIGQNIRGEIPGPEASVYNIDDTTTMTIELKVKKNQDIFRWPSILGKRNEWSSGHPSVGWVIYLEEGYWYFEWRGTKDADYKQCRGANLAKGKWENLSVKLEKRGNQRFIRTYTNGVFNNELEITASGSLANNNALKLGYLNGTGHGEPDVYVTDIRFFKLSVPDGVIGQYACETAIDQSHPSYNYLVGYWPATDGTGNRMADLSSQAHDFQMLGTFTWENFNDLICPPSASTLAVLVPQTSDIPSQVLNWLKIANKQTWQLDSRVWLDI
ncbi:alkaline phosphatase family protein [Pedobacter sandarakinus]|uniref:alkaline phosphatase family protein n=1 Tax=Pedobacter sandarakinus TaxID=353156 RepID=UPI002246C82A|nr:alkaline phosphatase family protein [Pedobacter sandarakinus]MCX2573170.1 DUF4983 domain-containing protein [Pedobacter sandarakinus]